MSILYIEVAIDLLSLTWVFCHLHCYTFRI